MGLEQRPRRRPVRGPLQVLELEQLLLRPVPELLRVWELLPPLA